MNDTVRAVIKEPCKTVRLLSLLIRQCWNVQVVENITFFNRKGSTQGGARSSHIDVSTCSAITCRPLVSSSVWHLFAMFRNNSGYRVSLCNGATSRSRRCSLRHCSFLSHHWERGQREREEKKRGGQKVKELVTVFVRMQGWRGGWAVKSVWRQVRSKTKTQ